MTKKIALVAGPLPALLIIIFTDLDPGNKAVTMTAGVTVWMAFL
jgi:hypothetical protein